MGCFKSLFAGIGCLTVVLVGGAVGWQYRSQLADAYAAFTGQPAPAVAAEAAPGSPSNRALRSARRKQESLSRLRGPTSVSLDPSEMASLIAESLDPVARQALDSLTVELEPDRFVLEAQLVTEVWGREALGMFAGFLQPREPLRVAGPAQIVRAGVLRWAPTELSLRGLPIPAPAIRPLVNSLTGGTDGAFWLAAPVTVGAMRIEPGQVTFFRRTP